MIKAEIFDINKKKEDQVISEIQMAPIDRLLLCLDLMDLSRALNEGHYLAQHSDEIEWIELSYKL